jgi:hypothetical protein
MIRGAGRSRYASHEKAPAIGSGPLEWASIMSISENQASLEIVQKKYSTTCTFVFEEQRLAYTIKDSSGRHSFAMDYVETPSQTD